MDIFEVIKKNWFNSIALLVGLVLVVNLIGGFTQLDLFWKRMTDKSLITDEEKWRAWLYQNFDLFTSLAEGSQIGITKSLDSDYGIIWTKQKNSFDVHRSNQLRKAGPGIILVFDDQVVGWPSGFFLLWILTVFWVLVLRCRRRRGDHGGGRA